MPAIPTVSVQDLEALEKYLISDYGPENGMGLSDLDGFLTAVIVGPELIIPSEWLPAVWGHEEAQFSDQRQADRVVGIIMRLYNHIAAGLNREPPRVDPLLLFNPDDRAIVSDWCAGFLDAIKLRPASWLPLIRDSSNNHGVSTILALGGEPEDYHLLGMRGRPPRGQAFARLSDQAAGSLADDVIAIRDYWRAVAATQDAGVTKH
jgi:uncharacterized protein